LYGASSITQELNALLDHLDKDNKGYVSIADYAQGLQAIKNSVAVGSVTPTHEAPYKQGFREVCG
jgi:Ca2+-binding EF-hand superfamily protein